MPRIVSSALAMLLPVVVIAQVTTVSINGPAEVAKGESFIARVEIDLMTDPVVEHYWGPSGLTAYRGMGHSPRCEIEFKPRSIRQR